MPLLRHRRRWDCPRRDPQSQEEERRSRTSIQGRAPDRRSTSRINGTIRCVLCTRTSIDEGLDQEGNSLDAQREAPEAYIASQRYEGWVCLPGRNAAGGFTGGNMQRPALERLFTDSEAGYSDCVVVYKVDRLSRSRMDFTRMMETFDKHSVSFVSVT